MDVYELKRRYESKFPNGHFFDPKTLKFFGQCLSKMRVSKGTVEVTDSMGERHKCYMLSAEGKDFFGKKNRSYYYFDADTFENIVP